MHEDKVSLAKKIRQQMVADGLVKPEPVRLPSPKRTQDCSGVLGNGRRVLFMVPHGLGDCALFTTVLQHIYAKWPKIKIDIQCRKEWASVFSGQVNRVLAMEDTPVAADYQLVDRVPFRLPERLPESCPANKPVRYLEESLGIPTNPLLCGYSIKPSDADYNKAERWLDAQSHGRGCVLIQAGGATLKESKDMDAAAFKAAVAGVKALGLRPLVLNIGGNCPHPIPDGCIDIGDESPMATPILLAALIARVVLFVGVDSGPGHLAAATATPTIICWTKHHPIQHFGIAANVLHLVPKGMMPFGVSGELTFFRESYRHEEYESLADTLQKAIRNALRGKQRTAKEKKSSGGESSVMAQLNRISGIPPGAFNGSIIQHEGQTLLAYRNRERHAEIWIAALDSAWHAIGFQRIKIPVASHNRIATEDPRLFRRDGKLWLSYVGVGLGDGGETEISVCMARLSANFEVEGDWRPQFDGRQGVEKNWQFFESTGSVLFLDDRRSRWEVFRKHVPNATHVRTAKECIQKLSSRPWDTVFLDHDLSCVDPPSASEMPDNNGMYVAKWIHANKPPIGRLAIHSTSQEPASRMADVLEEMRPARIPFDVPKFQGERLRDFASGLYCVYSTWPHSVLRVDLHGSAAVCSEVSRDAWRAPWTGGLMRGGAPPVLHNGRFLSFFHGTLDSTTPRSYSIGCYEFEATFPFRPLRCSRGPILTANVLDQPAAHVPHCVFPCGAFLSDGTWKISYGYYDHQIWVAEIPEEEIERVLC